MTDQIPEGFEPFRFNEGFLSVAGPYYFKSSEQPVLSFGLQTGPEHANPNGVLHGGVLMSFADTVMGTAVYFNGATARPFRSIRNLLETLSPVPGSMPRWRLPR